MNADIEPFTRRDVGVIEQSSLAEQPKYAAIPGGLGAHVSESSSRASQRSSAETLPCFDEPSESLPPPSGRPEWCVDVGAQLLTMTSYELWSAIERGQALGTTRAWREGLECWTPIEKLPEFAMALAATPGPREAALGPLPPPKAPPKAAERPAWSARATLESDAPELAVLPKKIPGVRWILAGSAIAAAAMVFALLRDDASVSSPSAGEGATAAEIKPAFDVAPAKIPAGAVTTEGALESDEARPLPAPSHGERGQRRLPRSGAKGAAR